MAMPNASGNASGSTYQCAVCYKILNSEKTLQQHTQTHLKQHQCSDCGESFARQDQVTLHRHKKHGHNTSPFICYIKGCNRSRLGLRDQCALVKHLANSHQGATTEDNKQAAADSGIQLTEESSNEEDDESDGDIAMTEAGDSSDAESEGQEETGEGHEHPLSNEYYRYRIQLLEEQIADQQDRLDKQEARHTREIGDIHRFYQGKLQDLEDKLAEHK